MGTIRTFRDDNGLEIDYELVENFEFVSGSYYTRSNFVLTTGTADWWKHQNPHTVQIKPTVFAPVYVRCSWCGVKNKEDEPYCIGCGGPL